MITRDNLSLLHNSDPWPHHEPASLRKCCMPRSPKRSRAGWLTLTVFASGLLSASAQSGAPPLAGYNAEIKESSISGISSGAFMAVQFGVSWSSVVKGVGAIAGGPYYCAQ